MTASEKFDAAETLRGKKIVVDTSSLLISGTSLIDKLQDCELVIPSVVIKELESKREHGTIGFLAREWIRAIDEMCKKFGEVVSHGIIVDGTSGVKLRIEPNNTNQESLPKHLRDGSHDSTILAVLNNIKASSEPGSVVLLSNDTPMRIHAMVDLGIDAYEFESPGWSSGNEKTKRTYGYHEIKIPKEDASEIESAEDFYDLALVNVDKFSLKKKGNFYVQVNSDGAFEPLYFAKIDGEVFEVYANVKAGRVRGRSIEQNIAMSYMQVSPDTLPVVSLGGSAGSGKTLIALSVALDELKMGNYQSVVVFKSLHEMGAGQEMGFLPGTVDEKMSAWAGAVYDAIDVIAALEKPLKRNSGQEAVNKQKEHAKNLRKMVDIQPITYLRGRSISNTFMILEEAQNFSRSELLHILSRVGQGTKVVLTFDSSQVDNKYLKSGSKADVWAVVKEFSETDIFAHVTLKKSERSVVAEVASRILEDYQ